MEYFFIDESGSNTISHCDSYPYFVICLVRVFNREKLKTLIKRFISANLENLKDADDGKMFKNDKFHELKGSSLSPDLKIKFATYLSNSNLFEVHYIVVNNKNIESKFYKNKARAFNYLLDLFLSKNLRLKKFPYDTYDIQIDERNVRTDAKNFLKEYLATELSLKHNYMEDVNVTYFDSANNLLIQLSDFFSNLYYSFLMAPNKYNKLIDLLKEKNILKSIFQFPNNKNKSSNTSNSK